MKRLLAAFVTGEFLCAESTWLLIGREKMGGGTEREVIEGGKVSGDFSLGDFLEELERKPKKTLKANQIRSDLCNDFEHCFTKFLRRFNFEMRGACSDSERER